MGTQTKPASSVHLELAQDPFTNLGAIPTRVAAALGTIRYVYAHPILTSWAFRDPTIL